MTQQYPLSHSNMQHSYRSANQQGKKKLNFFKRIKKEKDEITLTIHTV